MLRMSQKYVIENQSRNGVIVKVTRFNGGGTVVETTCRCFGHPMRTHSNPCCPNTPGR